jgi:hypothetical protein
MRISNPAKYAAKVKAVSPKKFESFMLLIKEKMED